MSLNEVSAELLLPVTIASYSEIDIRHHTQVITWKDGTRQLSFSQGAPTLLLSIQQGNRALA